MPHSPLGYHDFVEGCMRMRDSMNSYEVQSSNQFTWKTVHIEMGIYKILKERREQGKNGGMGK